MNLHITLSKLILGWFVLVGLFVLGVLGPGLFAILTIMFIIFFFITAMGP